MVPWTCIPEWPGVTYFSMPHKIQVPPTLTAEEDSPEWMHVYYDMEYVKENGVWKISLLKEWPSPFAKKIESYRLKLVLI
jgi:hypothetical protein